MLLDLDGGHHLRLLHITELLGNSAAAVRSPKELHWVKKSMSTFTFYQSLPKTSKKIRHIRQKCIVSTSSPNCFLCDKKSEWNWLKKLMIDWISSCMVEVMKKVSSSSSRWISLMIFENCPCETSISSLPSISHRRKKRARPTLLDEDKAKPFPRGVVQLKCTLTTSTGQLTLCLNSFNFEFFKN